MNDCRVLIVGCGHMGASHARAYHGRKDCRIVGVVSRGPESRGRLSRDLGGLPEFDNYEDVLEATRPDVVVIGTYTDTHAPFAIRAMEQGAHVFVEKPIALTVEEAETVVAKARETGRKVVVGYILRHHPSWTRFVDIARGLGKPLVMRMNLNQQSTGREWESHRNLMNTMSPIVDCGVHYVDIMCQMTRARPVRVQAVGARLSDEIPESMYNYGQLQVVFDDGSVGWYEAGWGPMMSETAHFVKDVVGPEGAVSIVSADGGHESADIDAHTKTNRLRVHHAARDSDGRFTREDDLVDMSDEPDHDELCAREQAYLLKAIRDDVDLSSHLRDAVNSLRIVLAADRSIKTGKAVELE
ncbi:MAG: Gfo/Idh/MocA family oxidoreductase [Candidatus Pacebacteria bacterium]|nr:Gfo/Idh/MocA family oxidoreductase [Candidatus Paceibacterota bacterium]